jgi:hypothetical protein
MAAATTSTSFHKSHKRQWFKYLFICWYTSLLVFRVYDVINISFSRIRTRTWSTTQHIRKHPKKGREIPISGWTCPHKREPPLGSRDWRHYQWKGQTRANIAHFPVVHAAAVYQWCEFKSRRGKNKNLTAQKSNSNTVWFNFQTYIYISSIWVRTKPHLRRWSRSCNNRSVILSRKANLEIDIRHVYKRE